MNLYLVSRTDRVGYDEYDSMVVAAENEDDARLMKPYNADGYDWQDWTDHPETLTVELIGTALDNTSRVVITSYNAG